MGVLPLASSFLRRRRTLIADQERIAREVAYIERELHQLMEYPLDGVVEVEAARIAAEVEDARPPPVGPLLATSGPSLSTTTIASSQGTASTVQGSSKRRALSPIAGPSRLPATSEKEAGEDEGKDSDAEGIEDDGEGKSEGEEGSESEGEEMEE